MSISNLENIEVDQRQAEEILKEIFGIKGSAVALPGEAEYNFRIDAEEQRYILKVSRPGADPRPRQFEVSVLNHLQHQAKDFVWPQSLPASGEEMHVRSHSKGDQLVRLLSWVDGPLWSSIVPIDTRCLKSLGELCGATCKALSGFDHELAHREFEWDLAQWHWVKDHFQLHDEKRQMWISYFIERFENKEHEYAELRKQVIHNDANDNNVVMGGEPGQRAAAALIDFGDTIYTQLINDLAIAIAYGVMRSPEPLSAASHIVTGFHNQFALEERELNFVYDLVAIRLIISVTKARLNLDLEPENEYLQISAQPAWQLLERWYLVDAELATASFRHACGLSPHPSEEAFSSWVGKNQRPVSALFPETKGRGIASIDLSVGSRWVGHIQELADYDLFDFKLSGLEKEHGNAVMAGGYLEPRCIYTTEAYDRQGNEAPESRTIHLALDFWLPAGTAVHALYDGVVHTTIFDEGDKEYGGLVILKHQAGNVEFFTLHGHLDKASSNIRNVGDRVSAGDLIGRLGAQSENGNWPPHLHFQLMLSMLEFENDFPGVAYANEEEIWAGICPDPNLIFESDALRKSKPAEIRELRSARLGASLSLSYSDPLHIIRGVGSRLIDNKGRSYLDTVNNVAHVGHEHPRIVKAGQEQMAVLNTNTRYLHPTIVEFAGELLSTMPKGLEVVHFVNSGSEANELAMRMAKAYSGGEEMIAMEVGYHGNSNACVDVSSYKFDGQGGTGCPPHTHIVPLPDAFRGKYRGEKCGAEYSAHVDQIVNEISQQGKQAAAFICESIISCGGQIELPEGFLKSSYESIRNAGGLCIADEVQVGCGRVGSHFWGFELHGVTPDIVTIGKPLGNGHPVAAVVCTREVADSFANGMEYFNTFGGNPVSCAIGLEVLRVIKEEGLQQNALETGEYLKSGIQKLATDHPIIADVRGQGLFLGFELCDNALEPLASHTSYLVNRMREKHVLMSTDGKDNNVIKIKPPMVISRSDADILLHHLNEVLSEEKFQNVD